MSKLNKDTYNLIAKNYRDDHGKRLPWQAELENFIKLLPYNPLIIDLGCGPGHESSWLASHIQGSSVIGIDFSEEMIKLSKQDSPNNTEFVIADIVSYHSPVPIDGLWARGSLHHLNDQELLDVFGNISSYMKSGSILNCINKKGNGELVETANKYGGTINRYFNFFTKEKVEHLADEFGFEVVNQISRKNDAQDWLISFLKKN